jgi:hypothetical protein
MLAHKCWARGGDVFSGTCFGVPAPFGVGCPDVGAFINLLICLENLRFFRRGCGLKKSRAWNFSAHPAAF